MTTLNHLIQKIHFQALVDFKNAPNQIVVAKKGESLPELKHFILFVSCVICLGTLSLCRQYALFDHTFIMLAMSPFFAALMFAIVPVSLLSKKYKKYKADLNAQQKTFKEKTILHLFKDKYSLAHFFKALEAEPIIRDNFYLPTEFSKIQSLIEAQAFKKDKNFEHKMIEIIEPMLTCFLKHEENKNKENSPEFLKNQEKERYQKFLLQSDADDLMFSTHPPLKANSRH